MKLDSRVVASMAVIDRDRAGAQGRANRFVRDNADLAMVQNMQDTFVRQVGVLG